MQKRLPVVLFAFVLTAQTPPNLGVPPASAVVSYNQPVIAIEHVRVIDGTLAPPREDQTVVVSHGKIAAVGASARTAAPANAKIIDGRGYTVTPGFVGTHDHLYYVSNNGPLFLVREQPYSFPRLYLAAGVTTIRTTGSVEPYTDLRIRSEIDAGQLVGPHLDVTSVYMTGYEPFFLQMGTLHNPAEARATVNYWADRGVTSFKLYMDIPPNVAQAVIDAAHARGLKVLAHLCSIGLTKAAQMGVDSLEHGIWVDTEFSAAKHDDECPRDANSVRESIADLDVKGPKAQALIRTMIAHHVALSSTLANFEGSIPPPMRVEQRMFAVQDAETVNDVMTVRKRIESAPATRRAVSKNMFANELAFEAAFYHAGGLLTQGPDPTGYGATIAGFGDQRDIELLVQGGLTPVEAIHVATENGAISLGRQARIGTVTAGKNADLLLIKGNPARNIDDVENVVTVFKDGVGYDSQKLIDSVKGIAGRQ
jgi:imidazolonepropionase-like amidohydrolase